MKLSFNLKLSQSLKLTPLLQQSIKFIQASQSELDDLIDEYLAENLFLEEDGKDQSVPYKNVTDNNSTSISQNYNIKEKHYAVDIVVAKDTPIKATADGVVIFSEWTTETGYVIIIEHSYGLISVYKHNAFLTKSQGDLVKSGEVIATAGNTGELTTGPHLHFELWSDGYPINPTNFIDFE